MCRRTLNLAACLVRSKRSNRERQQYRRVATTNHRPFSSFSSSLHYPSLLLSAPSPFQSGSFHGSRADEIVVLLLPFPNSSVFLLRIWLDGSLYLFSFFLPLTFFVFPSSSRLHTYTYKHACARILTGLSVNKNLKQQETKTLLQCSIFVKHYLSLS